MDAPEKQEEFKVKFPWFKTTTATDKETIFNGRKAENTNRATRAWVTCFNEYLTEKNIGPQTNISNDELPQILSDFYVDLRKKKVKK